MAQCDRVVNGELFGARSKSLYTQTLQRHFPPDVELLIFDAYMQSGSYQSFLKFSHILS